MPNLRITYRRSGGFAGIDLAADTAAHELPDDDAALATQLLANRQAPADADGAQSGSPDQFTYKLHLDDGARQETYHWSEAKVPDAVRPLLKTLNGRAAPSRPE